MMRYILVSLTSILASYLLIFYYFIILVFIDYGDLPLDDYSAKSKYNLLQNILDFYLDIIIYIWFFLVVSLIISGVLKQYSKGFKIGVFVSILLILHFIFDPFLIWYIG